ncbi:MAG: alpha/beta fold hydrolase [Actinomycetota bacterium]
MSVVALHGFTGAGATMQDLADRITAEVTAPDLAGHGLGPHPTDPTGYTVDAMAAAVLASTDDPIDLIGYSMGGRVALTAACHSPERVRSLTLIGASAGLADPAERSARAAADDELADLIERDLPGFVDRWMANPLFATQARLGDAFLADARAQRLTNTPSALATSLREASTGRMTPLHGLLARCVMPVGLIVGADDPKFQMLADELAAGLGNARIHVIDRAGHAAHLEQPDMVAAAIRETMARA